MLTSSRGPIRLERDVEVPMRDGVVLRADIWRLEGATEPQPAILRRTPYSKDGSPPNTDWFRITTAVEAGYTCVVQDSRGRYTSDGEWSAIMWQQEALDGHDTIEWVAAQPWCDGNVGMCGGSYLGAVQWLAAVERPPHLKAIAPAIAPNGLLDHLETGGAVALNQRMSWLAFMILEWLAVRQAAGEAVDLEVYGGVLATALDPGPAMATLPLLDLRALSFDDAPFTMRELLRGDNATEASFDYDDVDVPTLSIGGWYDIFARTTVEGFRRLQSRDPDGGHRLIMGPWVHAPSVGSEQGDLNFGMSAEGAYADLTGKHLAFFDRHLRGSDVDFPPVHYFVTGADEWRVASSWPPEGAPERQWHLTADGELVDGPPPAEAVSAFEYDPRDPVPSHGGRLCLGKLVSGPRDQAHLERRADVLTFTSPELAEPIELTGPVFVELWVESSAPDTDFVARLTDVHPDGRSILHADGLVRMSCRRPGEAVPPLVPGTVEHITIDLGPVAHRFEAGHRVRLDLTSSDFPRFDRNMNTGNPPGVDAKGEVARQRVHHAPDRPSHLRFTASA